MLEHLFHNPAVVERLRSDPLGSFLDSFAASLAGLGYATSTARLQIRLLANLSRWLVRMDVALADVNEQVADAFLDEQRRHGRLYRGHASTVGRFLGHLRQKGVIVSPEPAGEGSPLALVQSRYEVYLRTERGLARTTVDGYVFFIRGFLLERFGDGPLPLRELKPSDITSFILRRAHSMSPKGAKLTVTALRSFFRFLLQHGEIDTDLAASVPAVADWRRSTVPKYLTAEQIARLLDSCNQSTSTGRRDYAIVLLLARLGLRAGEVVALTLDHIDWRAGEIMVPGKGLVHHRLPLLAEAGEALTTYLHRDRPRCGTRRLFVRMKAPHRGFAGSSSVSTVVRRAIDRAGLHPPVKGAYLLRHSLATEMLRQGASMAEIGELLRHRAPNTTEIYAKVDIEGLRTVAQPWSGSRGGR